jgi:hypothetical protein
MGAAASVEGAKRGGAVEVLEVFHRRLDAHFAALQAQRQALDPSSPVFALEHDLEPADLALLNSAVRAAVVDGFGSRVRTWWLPFVVYAAEVAYDYTGVEYWPLFAQHTPGWESQPGWNLYGNRKRIQGWFERFAATYTGARPTGAFAENFSIISWPITNAVMPSYLQRQLAQLLYESRLILTRELLDKPVELGLALASRTASYSERFQIFCSNRALLGQVSAALLSGEEDRSPYLLPSTLHRLVESLSEEQQSKLWLTRARQSARDIRANGFRPRSAMPPTETRTSRRGAVIKPKLLLRPGPDGWRAFLEIPDLTLLEQQSPGIGEQLRALRAHLIGSDRPLARGRLTYPGDLVLPRWPTPNEPLLQLEGASSDANSVLASNFTLAGERSWLFRMQEDGTANEVKGRFMRPGRRYCIAQRPGHPAPEVDWMTLAETVTNGITLFVGQVPEQAANHDREVLSALGITLVSEVSLRPSGLVAAAWDGEGSVEWLAGEPALLAITSSRLPKSLVIGNNEGPPQLLPWPGASPEMLVAFDELEVGSHDLEVSLLLDRDETLHAGTLRIEIRDPHAGGEAASSGCAIRMFATPARPRLTDIWDGAATLSLHGPTGEQADLTISLQDEHSAELARLQRRVELPMDDAAWSRFATTYLRGPELRAFYDLADACKISIARRGVGFASLSCERGFQPLRWVVRSGRDRQRVRLVDRTDRDDTTVSFFSPKTPLVGEPRPTTGDIQTPANGGLLVARAGSARAAVVVPPDPNSMFGAAPEHPDVAVGARSTMEVARLIRGHQQWLEAELPADPFAVFQQERVLNAITARLCGHIAGGRWTHLEREYLHASDPLDLLEEMQGLVGEDRPQALLGRQVADELWRWSLSGQVLASGFAAAITPIASRNGMKNMPAAAELLLTLASEPGRLALLEERELLQQLEKVLSAPVLLRAARFAILGIACLQADNVGMAGAGR